MPVAVLTALKISPVVAAYCLAALLLQLPMQAKAMETPTPAQYEQAMGLDERYAALVDHEPAEPIWVDAQQFLYRRKLVRPGHSPAIEYRLVDAESGSSRLAFDHARLAAALTQAGTSAVDASGLWLRQLTLQQQQLRFQFNKLGW
ncbi:peptidase [Xanthomonas bromi]|uniref:Peptidase n=1 Tax=Xanthomonas bromi TaxID=56449 RepID=A0A1C3NK56_9XANT|nr:peptidase [Xanthomonas bromi]